MTTQRPDATTVNAYLARLGVPAEPPSAAGLFRLHQAHVERVPYETAWIHLGERWDIDPHAAMQRIAHEGRGGYCYHLNGAFALLLQALGYHVTLHAGGVFVGEGPSEQDIPNHLALTVHDLPTHEHSAGSWYVDTGLGDALFRPMPLTTGPSKQGPFRYRLDATPSGIGDWQFTHDPAGSFRGMVWRSAPVTMDAFSERHDVLSTSPQSGFVRVFTVQRRSATGVDIVRGRVFRRMGDGAFERLLVDEDDWRSVLANRFGLPLLHVEPSRLTAVWDRIQRAHAAWEASLPSQSSG